MKPKTAELLYLLLWACDTAARPTFRNLTDSFEAWAYRSGLHRQLAVLEQQQLLEARQDSSGSRLHRLTEAGRLIALGSRDPVARWKRRWDGKWRMVLFDVPQSRASDRARLRRSLADRGFGYLQDSVWITPDALTGEREVLATGPVDVESLILLEARPCAGESNADIVAGAWDSDAINKSLRVMNVTHRFWSDCRDRRSRVNPQPANCTAGFATSAWPGPRRCNSTRSCPNACIPPTIQA
jgi:phenylacetic acid degradation operon negative regulatory protein